MQFYQLSKISRYNSVRSLPLCRGLTTNRRRLSALVLINFLQRKNYNRSLISYCKCVSLFYQLTVVNMSCLNVPEGRVDWINLGSNEASDNRFDVFSMSYYKEELAVFSFLARLFVHLSSTNEKTTL